MKKSARVVALVMAIVAVVGIIGWFGTSYYKGRYVGQTYYAMVPLDEPVEVSGLLDMSGKVADSGYEYKLTAYDEEGNSKAVEFSVYSENVEDLYQPGTFLKVEASEQIVVEQHMITRDEVPTSVLAMIEGNQ